MDYDPAWPGAFEEARAAIERLLGGLVLEIHHIGSTSVPGLCAKPKIDVDIVLRSAAEIPQAIERMKAEDFTYHGDKYQEGMWAFTTGRGSHGERFYLCAPGTLAHLRRLLFRDYLRGHPETAAAYGVLKRKLASEVSGRSEADWDHYTGGKGPFVAETLRKAAASGFERLPDAKVDPPLLLSPSPPERGRGPG